MKRTQAKQHFKINRPLETHWRAAECREVDCPHYLQGWATLLDEMLPKHRDWAEWIRHESGRRFTEERNSTGITVFDFPSGQRCFRPHKRPLDRQEVFTHEANGRRRVHERPTDWTEHFNEETEKTRRALERG